MRRSRLVAAGAAVLLTAGFGIGFASPASANQVWLQQVQRSGADAPCDIPAVEGEAAGWSEWAPSWAQWPNGGEGGWVCTRSITWAKDTPPPSAMGGMAYPSGGCEPVQGSVWAQFDGGWSVPHVDPAYSDAACTALWGAPWNYNLVYAPSGWDPTTLCIQAWGTAADLHNFGTDVWGCEYFAP